MERVLQSARDAGAPLVVPGTSADQHIAIVPGSKPTDICLAEVALDSRGTMPYAAFLAYEGVGDDGRLGGQVVFARDMGPRNELLRERFGDRTWYRYVPAAQRPSNDLAFAPYERLGHRAN
jgi:hypothetical protein